MSVSGLEVLDTSIQKTNIWLKELMERLETADRHRAYMALKVTLHALRDRLSVEEAAQLGAQLPLIVRGLFYEGWRPTVRSDRASSWENFMKPVYLAVCQDGSCTPEEVVSAVFDLLSRHVTSGEIDDVIAQLPRDIRSLWPAQARTIMR
ncbi:MAG: DUF2267 domain-containing protein [Dongiaceae bacterium]